VCNFLTGHASQISSLQQFLVGRPELADTGRQGVTSSLLIDRLFLDLSSQQIHNIFPHQLQSMMPTATKTEYFQSCYRLTPRREIRPGLELFPFAKDHHIRFLKYFFGISGGPDQRQNEQIDRSLSLRKQPNEIFTRA
jgi:hypothetical protein